MNSVLIISILNIASLMAIASVFYTVKTSNFSKKTRFYLILILSALMPALFFSILANLFALNFLNWLSGVLVLIMSFAYLFVSYK